MMPAEQRRFLERQRVARIATLNRNGTIHMAPIHFAWDGKYIYSTLSRKSRRFHNIVRRSSVSILIDLYEEKPPEIAKAILMYGDAEIVNLGPKQKAMKAWNLLTEKYPQYINWLTNRDSTPKDSATWKIMCFKPQKTIVTGFTEPEYVVAGFYSPL